MRSRLALWLTALAVALAPASARADKVDVRLNQEMIAIKKHLDSRGYKNVGVLRFRVQKGKLAPKFDNAPYNGNLATRLENLLVIHGGSDESKAIGVTRDAGVAASAGVGDWFADADERKKLFDVEYPLAWGKKKVKVDAFLTGLVQSSADRKKTTFTVSCFDRANLEPKVVGKFTLDTDRDILRDLGMSFDVSRKARESLVTKRKNQDVDKGAIDSADDAGGGALDDVRPGKDKDKGKPKDKDDDKGGVLDDQRPKDRPKPGKVVNPKDMSGIELTVLVGGKEVPLDPAEGDGPPLQLVSPAPGQPIVFRFKNTSAKTLGVVFKVNGVSTFNDKTGSPDQCNKWVVRPGKTAPIRGFYAPDGKEFSLKPFKILVGKDASDAKAQFADKAGLLEIDVFAEGKIQDDDDKLEVSLKGMPPSKEKQARETYKSLRTALLKSAKLKADTNVTKKEIFVPDEEALTKVGGEFVDFEGYVVTRLVVKIVPGKGD